MIFDIGNIMAKEYCPEYVESLQKVAEKMVHALQLQQQLNKKTGRVSPEVTADKIDSSVNEYYELLRDHSND